MKPPATVTKKDVFHDLLMTYKHTAESFICENTVCIEPALNNLDREIGLWEKAYNKAPENQERKNE